MDVICGMVDIAGELKTQTSEGRLAHRNRRHVQSPWLRTCKVFRKNWVNVAGCMTGDYGQRLLKVRDADTNVLCELKGGCSTPR